MCRAIVGGASITINSGVQREREYNSRVNSYPRLFPQNPQKIENEIARCVSDRNATFLFRNGIMIPQILSLIR
jgi:hypothetical protein